ncbi:hypothetical protein LF599_10340 [Pseudodesulfovibrio thermohalotolerans]|uniref:hypothetical protein n=1 Tax=Pseudodesulfovibrio thermohalotolerans TaxID=2880651 RepID=UPI0022BA025C|nr:hypothetical protein [Pseudodesulfovibrio thermohalotolerans]WFS61079.1 hypothetical protein LF599_10340 [Pseudodesulfovibrio thermohalotolerans]
MPIAPDPRPSDDDARRELTARCLLEYAEQLPIPTEQRLALVLETLRELPRDASSAQALEALLARLPAVAPSAHPPSHPPIDRSHMPAQYLGRPHSGLSAFLVHWAWLGVVGLLLALTLLLNFSQ